MVEAKKPSTGKEWRDWLADQLYTAVQNWPVAVGGDTEALVGLAQVKACEILTTLRLAILNGEFKVPGQFALGEMWEIEIGSDSYWGVLVKKKPDKGPPKFIAFRIEEGDQDGET